MRKLIDRGRQHPQRERRETQEDLYSAKTLIRKVESKSDLFKTPNFLQRRKIRSLSPEQRMPYILDKLALQKITIQYPKQREVRKAKKLLAWAQTNLLKHFFQKDLDHPFIAANIQRVIRQIEDLANWLQTPAIYDLREDHDERRAWEKKMFALFDHGTSNAAKGPFADFYNRNIIAPSVSTSVFQSTVLTNILANLGLRHATSESVLQDLSDHSKYLSRIKSAQVQERVNLIQNKIKPTIWKLLVRLANRSYARIGEPVRALPTQQSTESAFTTDIDKEYGPKPEWLD